MHRLQVRSRKDTKHMNRQNVEASQVLTEVVGGEAVSDEGGGSVQKHGDDDAEDLLGRARTEYGDTGQVDGGFRRRHGGRGKGEGRRTAVRRSGSGWAGDNSTRRRWERGSGETLTRRREHGSECERGSVGRARAGFSGSAERLDWAAERLGQTAHSASAEPAANSDQRTRP